MTTLLGIDANPPYDLTATCRERGSVPIDNPDNIAETEQTRIQNLNDLIGLLGVAEILRTLVNNPVVTRLGNDPNAQSNPGLILGARTRLRSESSNMTTGETAFERYMAALRILVGLSRLPDRDREMAQAALEAYQAASDRIDDIHFSDARFNDLVSREPTISQLDNNGRPIIDASRTLAAVELGITDLGTELGFTGQVSIGQLREEVGTLCEAGQQAPVAVSPPPPVEPVSPPPEESAEEDEDAPLPQRPGWLEEHLRSAVGGAGLYRLGSDSQWMLDGWAVLGFRFDHFDFNVFGRYGASFGPAATDDQITYDRYSYRYLGGEVGLNLGRWDIALAGGWLASEDIRFDKELFIAEERAANLGVVEARAAVNVSRGEIYLDAGAIFNSDSTGFIGRLGTDWLWAWGSLDFHAAYSWFDENSRVGGGFSLDFGLWDIPRTGLRLSAGFVVEGIWAERGESNDGVFNAGATITVGNPNVREPLILQGMGM